MTTFRNVELTFTGGAAAGTYSLYENVSPEFGKPYHIAEDHYKMTGNVSMIDYADKLIRLPAPEPKEVKAPLEEVTWYFTEEGWREFIGSERQLTQFFNGVTGGAIRAPYREARVNVTETENPGRIVYEDEYQIAAV